MISIKVEFKGFDILAKDIENKAMKVNEATAKALTSTAYSVRKAINEELKSKLDNPKPYTTRQAIQVIEATPNNLRATVGLGVRYDAPSKGTPYQKALGHLFTGGRRRYKKIEAAFWKLGVLPAGWMIVPGEGCPLDQYGNIPSGFVVQMLSYFKAFSEQGYRANMTDKKRAKMADVGRTANGYKTINGAVYFISRGKGNWSGSRSWKGGRVQHLSPGVWKKTGIHGGKVVPVLMFVRAGNWQKRFDLLSTAKARVSERFQYYFDKEVRKL